MCVVDIDSNMYTAEGLAYGGNQCIPYILRYTLLHHAMHRPLHKCGLAPSKGPPNLLDHTIGRVRVTGHRASGVYVKGIETRPRSSDTDQYIRSSINIIKKTYYSSVHNIPTPDHPRTRSLGPRPPRTSIWCAHAQKAAARGAEIAHLEMRASGANGTSGATTTPPMPAASCRASVATERNVSRSAATTRPRSIAVSSSAPSGAGAVGRAQRLCRRRRRRPARARPAPRAGRCARRARAAKSPPGSRSLMGCQSMRAPGGESRRTERFGPVNRLLDGALGAVKAPSQCMVSTLLCTAIQCMLTSSASPLHGAGSHARRRARALRARRSRGYASLP
jgi:hypothetical protein